VLLPVLLRRHGHGSGRSGWQAGGRAWGFWEESTLRWRNGMESFSPLCVDYAFSAFFLLVGVVGVAVLGIGIEMRQHAACKQVAAALQWYSHKMKQG